MAPKVFSFAKLEVGKSRGTHHHEELLEVSAQIGRRLESFLRMRHDDARRLVSAVAQLLDLKQDAVCCDLFLPNKYLCTKQNPTEKQTVVLFNS